MHVEVPPSMLPTDVYIEVPPSMLSTDVCVCGILRLSRIPPLPPVWYSSDTTRREIYDSDSSTLPKRPLVRFNQIQCLSTLSFSFTAQQSQRVSLSELPHLEILFVSLSQFSNLKVTSP